MNQIDFQKAVMASDLDGTSRWVLIVIASHIHWKTKSVAFPSIETIAKECGVSKATVHRAKLKLIEKGWLVSNRHYNKSNTYMVHVPVVSNSDIPSINMRVDSVNMRVPSLKMREGMSQNEELTENITENITKNRTKNITDKNINNSFDKELLVKSKIKEIQEGLLKDSLSDKLPLAQVKAITPPPQNLTAEQKELLAGEWR